MARYGGYHMVPANMHSIVVHDHDVLSGRGVNIAHHPGNERFRTLVTTKADSNYCSTYSTTEKKRAAEEIIRHIQSLDPPGRFLRREGRANNSRGMQGPWFELSEKEVLKKTTQALRDCNRQDRTGYAVGVAMPEDVKVAVERQQQTQQQRPQSDAGGAKPAPVSVDGSDKRSLSPSVEQGAKWLKRQRTGKVDATSTLSPSVAPHISTVTPAGSAEHGSGNETTTTISAVGAPPAPPLSGVNYTTHPSLAMAPAPSVVVYQDRAATAPPVASVPGSSSHPPYHPAPAPVAPPPFYAMEHHHLAQDLMQMATSIPTTVQPPTAPTHVVYAPAPAAYGRPAPAAGAPVVYVRTPAAPYAMPTAPTALYVADPLGRAPCSPREAVPYGAAPVVAASPTSPEATSAATTRGPSYHPTYDTRQAPAVPPMPTYQPVAPIPAPPVPPSSAAATYGAPAPVPVSSHTMASPAPSPYATAATVTAVTGTTRLVHHDHGTKPAPPPLPDTPTPAPAAAIPSNGSIHHYDDYGIASDDGAAVAASSLTNHPGGSDASSGSADPLTHVLASSASQTAQGSADPLADLIAVSESVREEDHLGFHIAAGAAAAQEVQDGTEVVSDVF